MFLRVNVLLNQGCLSCQNRHVCASVGGFVVQGGQVGWWVSGCFWAVQNKWLPHFNEHGRWPLRPEPLQPATTHSGFMSPRPATPFHSLHLRASLQVAIRDATEDLRRAGDYCGQTAGQELEAARVSKQWLERYLMPQQKEALARLSVFRGSFSADGAAALQILGGGQPSDPAAVNAAILQLRNLSLLQPAQSSAAPGAPPRYAMHTLVGGIAGELLVQQSRDSGAAHSEGSLLSDVHMLFAGWMLQLGGQLDVFWNNPGGDSLQRSQALLADEELNFQHLVKLLHHECVPILWISHCQPLLTLAWALMNRGKLQLAHGFNRHLLKVTLRVLGPHHSDTGSAYDNLGLVLRQLGKLEEAEQAHRVAARIKLQTLGLDHHSTGGSYDSLGLVLSKQGKLVEAELAHRKGLQITLNALGPYHHLTGGSYDNLGIVLMEQGKLAEAEHVLRKGLWSKLQALGPDHSSTAGSYNNLGLVLREQGRLVEAEQAYRTALQIKLQNLGPDHFSTRASYNNLGLVLRQQGKLAETEQARREDLQIRVQALGPDHYSTGRLYTNLGNVLRQQGKLTEAEQAHRKGLRSKLQALGPDHSSTEASYSYLGMVLSEQGKLAEAEQAYREGLRIKLQALGPDHSSLGASFNNLGIVLRRQGKLADAEQAHHEGLRIKVRALGPEHPSTVQSHNNLRLVLRQQAAGGGQARSAGA
jgi:tetratricopeptide (TPR) repeat protein